MAYRCLLSTLPFCLALAFMGSAGAVERTETVECELADGSAFVLQATHQWTPLAVFARHASAREDQDSFKVSYRARGSRELVDTGAALAHQRLDQRANMEVLCARLGMYEGQPGTGASLRMPGEKRFWVPASTAMGDLDEVVKQRVDAQLKQRGLHVMDKNSAIAIRQGKLVQELPLYATNAPDCADPNVQQCPVSAVLRMTSNDRGETWQPASIESAPYFFKTGVALARQAGVARPSARSLRNYRNRDENGAKPLEQPCQKKCTE
ncbi:hypothetical protein [Massilia pseudoviolaceinigra]|uniref:hypothetical protein n=1 Tax=Massilia pseudoviolaceinigra TaxID=3057165 RepID=UPI00279665FD|nr:hypothetical protein [Massilia sp. CCM 9206]MDQ1924158.1 hypothetical protein [Massilia sp. CCM 9206]